MAALRNHTFFSLPQLNEAIDGLLDKLNHRPFKKLEGSRQSCFEAIEKKALLALPQSRYVFAEWKKAGVNIDYHVDLERHYYSVPYKLLRKKVQICYTATTVEIFYKGKRVASHKRSYRSGHHSTQKEHMPKSHQQHLGFPPSRIINWASTIGKSCAQVVDTIMKSRQHAEQGYRSCLGILRLANAYSHERLEAACKRAIAISYVTTKVFARFWKKDSIRSLYQMLRMPPKLNIKILEDEAITLTTSNLKEEKRQANFILAKN